MNKKRFTTEEEKQAIEACRKHIGIDGNNTLGTSNGTIERVRKDFIGTDKKINHGFSRRIALREHCGNVSAFMVFREKPDTRF